MRYRVKKETKPRLQTFGKYKAVAVHYQTIESNQLLKETAQRTGFSEGTIQGVLMSVAEVVNSHLREAPRSTSAASVSISSLKATKAPKPSTKASPSKKTKPSRRNSINTHCENFRCEKFRCEKFRCENFRMTFGGFKHFPYFCNKKMQYEESI